MSSEKIKCDEQKLYDNTYITQGQLNKLKRGKMSSEKKKQDIQQQIHDIESQYPNLHIDLHRDQFKSGDVDKLHLLYNQLEEVKKYGDVNQGLGTWNGYEYVK